MTPALDIAVGKWFTPGIDMRLVYSSLQQKEATQKGALSHSAGGGVPGKGGSGHWLEKQKFDMASFYADTLFNFSNLSCGYNEKRIWSCSPYTGLERARVWKPPSAKEVGANTEILNSFRLYSALNLNLDIRTMLVNDRFDGEGGGRLNEGMLSAAVGLAYEFRPHDWSHSKAIYRYDYGDLGDMRRKLNEMSTENERLKRALAEGNVQGARTIIKKIATANLVTFSISKSKLDNEARINLGMPAEIIKSGDPEATYTVTGCADAGTGSKKGSEKLSKEHIHTVYDYLVEEFGIKESQLRIDYKDGMENMFYNDPRLSRAIITRSE